MGRNAQRRRTARDAERSARPSTVRQVLPGGTRTLQRLRRMADGIRTRQQLEECIAKAHPDHRGPIRKLLEGMVPEGLPCCGPGLLIEKTGRKDIAHGQYCPTRNRVVLATS